VYQKGAMKNEKGIFDQTKVLCRTCRKEVTNHEQQGFYALIEYEISVGKCGVSDKLFILHVSGVSVYVVFLLSLYCFSTEFDCSGSSRTSPKWNISKSASSLFLMTKDDFTNEHLIATVETIDAVQQQLWPSKTKYHVAGE
jgi:hypothetical protein